MSLKLWECLRSRNPGWFCLYCSISECVLNQSQQTRTVSFSHRRTHIFIHKEKSAMRSSPCLSPSWPQLLSPLAPVLVCGYQSLPLFMKCGSGSNELPKRDPVKPSDTQCYNRWNSWRVMGVNVQTCSLQTNRCMSVLALLPACYVVYSFSCDTSVNISMAQNASVAIIWCMFALVRQS